MWLHAHTHKHICICTYKIYTYIYTHTKLNMFVYTHIHTLIYTSVYCIFLTCTCGFIFILFVLWFYSFQWLYNIHLWPFLLFLVASLLCLFSVIKNRTTDILCWLYHFQLLQLMMKIPRSSTLHQRVPIFNILQHSANVYPQQISTNSIFLESLPLLSTPEI